MPEHTPEPWTLEHVEIPEEEIDYFKLCKAGFWRATIDTTQETAQEILGTLNAWELRKQRDELLAACKELTHAPRINLIEAFERIEKAIARCEGK